MDDKPSFLSRWAQRKAEQNNQLDTEASELVVPDNSATEITSDSEDIQTLTDSDMPEIETLNESSDFSQFFSTGVSEELRDLALQKLFRLPEFNLRDGLNDYDDDFSKMPALTEAVASKLRNWANEQKEAFEEQLSDEVMSEEQPSEETQPEAIDTPTDEDELGDADLEG